MRSRTASLVMLCLLAIAIFPISNRPPGEHAISSTPKVIANALLSAYSPPTAEVASASDYIDVNVSKAKQMMDSDPNLVILDVRTQVEYDSGHIQNATLIPVTELASRLGELNKDKEILVYCMAGGRSATASQRLVDNGFLHVYNMVGGITAWRSAGYWIEMIHNGDLIINGIQTYVIENATFIENGNIIVKDNAELRIQNSRLVLNVSYWNEFMVSLYDGAVLDAKGSVLDRGTNTQVLLEVLGNAAVLRMLNTTCYLAINSRSHGNITIDSSEINGQIFWHAMAYSRMSIVGSSVQHELSVSFPGKFGGTVNLVGLKTGQLENVNIEIPGDGFLKISNSSVSSWCLNWEPLPAEEECHLIVENSTILGLWMTFYEGSEVKLRDLKAGFVLHWNLHEEAELKNVKHNLTIVNSYVEYWKLITQGKAEFFNVRDVQVSTYSNASAVVQNSTVTYCLNMRGMKDHVLFKDSIITRGEACFIDGRYAGETMLKGGDIHYAEFQNTTIDTRLYICTTYTYIKGDLTFLVKEANYVWGTVEREYSVVVKNKNNEPEENTTVGLFDFHDNCVLRETSDAQGRVIFNLTFTERNYTDAMRLEVFEGNYSALANVTFLSDTPIILKMRYHTDLNGDGRVNILDISAVAKAYGAKPGDPNWNAIADLDKNEWINILDISVVAKDYGKTV